MADQKLTALTSAGTIDDADLVYVVQNVSTTPVSRKSTVQNFFAPFLTFLRSNYISYKVQSLGTNPTTVDADSVRTLNITAAAFTSNTTLTFSNVTNLFEFTMQLTNTNANVLTFSGITLYFKSDDLPSGVSFASNALTFPADSAVKYNIVGVKFDGSTFDCKIEIR